MIGTMSEIYVGVALFATTAAVVYSQIVKRTVNLTNNQSKTTYRLLVGEQKIMIRVASITTITFYTGKPSIETICNKVTEIVSANNWLLSRLICCEGHVCAQFPSQFDPTTDNHDCFQCITDSTLSSSMPYEQLVNRINTAIVPLGIDCLNKDIGLFKVTLVDIKPNEEFAIVVSLSHTLGDGHTFYSIYSMLDIKTPARSLIYARTHEFIDVLHQTLGKEYINWQTSICVLIGILRTLFCMPIPTITAYSLNTTIITNLKTQYSTTNTNKFISTNDIITAWFFQLCGSNFGFMAINYRNKHPDYVDDMAGNYEGAILYNAKNTTTPAQIRESISTFNKGCSLPTILQSLELNACVVTNWSSFYSDVILSTESNQTIHLPIVKVNECALRDACIIYNTNKSNQAVLMLSRSRRDIGSLCECGSESVSILGIRII